jgi:hypothetical protein
METGQPLIQGSSIKKTQRVPTNSRQAYSLLLVYSPIRREESFIHLYEPFFLQEGTGCTFGYLSEDVD